MINRNPSDSDFHPLVLLFSPREEMRSILTAGLLQANYRVMESDTSYIAGIKANQYIPDLVIADITKNNIRDFLLLTRLQRSIRTQNIDILISLSSEVKEALEQINEEVHGSRSAQDPHVHLLQYPYHFADMLSKIDSIVKRKRTALAGKPLAPAGKFDYFTHRLFDLKIASDDKLREIESLLDRQWAFPFTVVRSLNIAGSESSCCAELGKCIEADPGATSAILRAANTVYYGKREGRISNVAEAVVRLGFNKTRNLLSTLALIDLSPDLYRKYGFNRRDFWMHSLATAIIAEKLCFDCGYERPELAFVSGLLHDLGKIPLDNNFPNVFPRLLEETTNRIEPFFETEQRMMGFTHADLGHHLTGTWNFPASITGAILAHHQPDKILETSLFADRVLQSSVFAGNIFAKAMNMGYSCDEVLAEIPDSMLRELKIPGGPDPSLFQTATNSLRQFWEYMGLPKDDIAITRSFPDAKEFEVAAVLGSRINFHPLLLALSNNGFVIRTSRDFSQESSGPAKIVVFIPDRGSPLEMTVGGETPSGGAMPSFLKVFLLDGLDPNNASKDFTRSDVVLMPRQNLDFRLVLHVFEDYYYASSIQ